MNRQISATPVSRQTTRPISSQIVSEQYFDKAPQPNVRYVEVPVVQEVIKRVPVKQVVEVEKIVPKYETTYVDRIVDVPQVHVVDRQVVIPQVHEVIRHVPRREVVEVPREVIRHVPKIETVVVEKVVEIPGQVIEIPKPYVVENKIPVARFVDREVPTIVAQTVKPVITQADEKVDVDIFEYEPKVIVVDVHVAKPFTSTLVSRGVLGEEHRHVTVPAAQYNSLLKHMNGHLAGKADSLPFIKDHTGAISFIDGSFGSVGVPLMPGAQLPTTTTIPTTSVTTFMQRASSVYSSSVSPVYRSSSVVRISPTTSKMSALQIDSPKVKERPHNLKVPTTSVGSLYDVSASQQSSPKKGRRTPNHRH